MKSYLSNTHWIRPIFFLSKHKACKVIWYRCTQANKHVLSLFLSLARTDTHMPTHTHAHTHQIKKHGLQQQRHASRMCGLSRTGLTDPSGGQHTSAKANIADTTAISITDTGTPRSPRCSKILLNLATHVGVSVIQGESGLLNSPIWSCRRNDNHNTRQPTRGTDHPDWRTGQEIGPDSQSGGRSQLDKRWVSRNAREKRKTEAWMNRRLITVADRASIWSLYRRAAFDRARFNLG